MCYQLNDDCWAVILRYLGLKDQLSVMRVSEDMKSIVQSNWRYIKEAHIDSEILRQFAKNTNEMHDFLKSASGSLKRLLFCGPFLDILLPSWKSYDFPKLRSLDCNTWYGYEHDDDVTLLLTELFPEVTKLKLGNTNHGHHLWNFSKLEDLNLHCSSLDTPTLDRIFGSLPLRKLLFFPFPTSDVGDLSLVNKCVTLEELWIEDYNVTFDMLDSLLKLPRFKRLCFYTRDDYDNYMYNLKHLDQESRVRSFLFSSCTWKFYNFGSFITRFSNLSRLVILNDDIDKKQLYIICSNLKQLEEFHLIDNRDFLFATDMWNLVGACRSLRLLNIANNDLDESFLDESRSCLHRVLKRRNADSPVTFYVHNTRLANDPQEVQQTNLNYIQLK